MYPVHFDGQNIMISSRLPVFHVIIEMVRTEFVQYPCRGVASRWGTTCTAGKRSLFLVAMPYNHGISLKK